MKDPSFIRPIVITANSSSYLVHYRKLLIKNLNSKNQVITITPQDHSSITLSKISINLPWRIERKKDRNPISFIFSLLRMFFLIRAVKPKIVHSHTLRTNLIIAIVCHFYRIPCILSFTGLGILSKENESKLLFKIILKTIMFFSINQKNGLIFWKKNSKRSRFIFQNKNDLSTFSEINKNAKYISRVIYGSGIPKKYFTVKKTFKYHLNEENSIKASNKFQFIYCARLLISKGIKTFLQIADSNKDHDFIIYGSFDHSSKDSIKKSDFLNLSEKENIIYQGNIKNPLLNIKYPNPILVIPSDYGEGFPRAILEAFALRIPVISSLSATINLFTRNSLYIAYEKEVTNYNLLIVQIIKDKKNGNLEKKINYAYNFSKRFTEKEIVKETKKLYFELS